MKFAVLSFSLLLLASCSMWKTKTKANFERTPQSTSELIDEVPNILADVKNPSIFNEDSCSQYIRKLTDYLYDLPSNYYYPKSLNDREYLMIHGQNLYNELYILKLTIQERLANFKNPSNDCVASIRKGMRVTRYVTDGLADWLLTQGIFKSNKLSLTEIGSQTLLHPDYKNEVYGNRFLLKTGDVILMRGQTFISAMIARIGDEDSNFSHLGIVGEDENGKQYIVEALIETGTIITPLEEWLKKEEARLVVYRHRDSQIADRAGKLIYTYVKNRLKKGGVLPYDFGMDPSKHDELFCSEVVQVAYELATDKKSIMPSFKTSFRELSGEEFIKDMGIKVLESFAPSDIETDTNFIAVAEYRYFDTLRKLKLQDAVLSSIYNWMIKADYAFMPNAKAFILSRGAWSARQLGFAKTKMQKNMPASTLSTVIKFQDLTVPIEKYIFPKEAEFHKKHGYSYTYKELLHVLDDYRKKDCEKYTTDQESWKHSENGMQNSFTTEFHHVFNSKLGCVSIE